MIQVELAREERAFTRTCATMRLLVAIMGRMMTTVGIRELKNQTSELIRRVEAGEQITITNHGRVVARIVPATVTPQEIEQSLAMLDELDELVGEAEWLQSTTLENVMDEVRR
jgi:prevent-host-death family protein